ncbi:pyrroloquinoline quinone-dependent dehydrogenase [Acidisphaera rubrifaciens]|uniref:Alcohol dehydrogenase PQQ-dependent, large subunit n=1 Tax=Acidisphaera rubrifaciens HS-AP3 TaxID=1231350 RepID=A0A0D6P5I0_9PROT|nr:PQQ-dependent dehydrogenase, methanol/ethanol family [Acidisphaera rubrifaciens]GAN77030.1 alcohol dehydrogenase PQQ-dependent, large subunit [Acidisphaera rubrifaciens HS-AP3]
MRMRRHLGLALGAAALLALGLGGARAGDGDWASYGHDQSNTRFSPLDQISTSNVKDLRVAWAFPLGVLEGQESTPLVIGDTMYVTSPRGPKYVYALDARDGTIRWKYAPEMPADVSAAVCCGSVNRGAAYADGRLFVSRLDGYLVALDAKTGKQLWKTKVSDYKKGDDMTSPPTIVKNLVVTGYAGGEYATRGSITAFDQATGKEVWRTYTTPAPGEKGSETWPSTETALHGGGDAWLVGSYDPKLNLIYYGTSNPAPWAAGQRGPDSSNYGRNTNLYTSSTLALDGDTGKIVWYYQQTPYDAWDYDGVNEKVLVDLTVDGKSVPALMTADRNGYFYVLDRRNGHLLSADPFVHMTWSKGIAEDGRPIEVAGHRPMIDKWARDLCPSFYGGKNFPPTSYDPQTKLSYVPTFNLCMDEVGHKVAVPREGLFYLGTEFNCCYAGPGGNGGEFIAWDPVEKKKVWGIKEDMPFVGGALSTAGGLVFYGNMQGVFKAVDAKDGHVLWSFPTGSGISQGAITYEVDGRQYVAALSGRLVGPPGFAGALGAKISAAVPEGATMFVFALPAK